MFLLALQAGHIDVSGMPGETVTLDVLMETDIPVRLQSTGALHVDAYADVPWSGPLQITGRIHSLAEPGIHDTHMYIIEDENTRVLSGAAVPVKITVESVHSTKREQKSPQKIGWILIVGAIGVLAVLGLSVRIVSSQR